MTNRQRVRRVMASMLAALTLSLGLAQTATGAAPGDNEGRATETVKLSPAKVVNPSGKAESKHPRQDVGPRPTLTAEQLAASQKMRPQQRPTVGSQKSLAPPASQGSFEGLAQPPSTLRPPDTHGAVGLNHFVEVVNGRGVGVYTKAGTLVKNVTFASFFGYTAQTIFDPRVVYDKKWNRWIIVAEAFPESSTVQRVFFAVSTTSDPTGSFFIYSMDPPENPGDFFDYPQLGMDQDALIFTANIFNLADVYVRSRVFGIAKADFYNGFGATFPYFNVGTPGTVAPPIVEDNRANAYLVAASPAANNVVRLFRATGMGRSNASVVLQSSIPVPAFSVPPDARQPGSTNRLDTLDARFQNNSTQIGNQLLNIHTINTSGFPTPKWYQFNTSTNAVTTSGFVLETGDSDDFNPSVVGSRIGGTATNPIGRMFFTWSATDAVGTGLHQARVKGSGRLATDPVTVFGGSTFANAAVPYNPSADTVERWGDYSAVTIDPVSYIGCPTGNRAFLVNERHINSTQWGSRIGRLGFC